MIGKWRNKKVCPRTTYSNGVRKTLHPTTQDWHEGDKTLPDGTFPHASRFYKSKED
ncbi:MAG: hypothetical protein O3C20_18100 [Verrucomicrobia bacterium]|nr:hypothetical protein [Verrucomicrobiota bacterium]